MCITRGNKNKCYYCGLDEHCTKDHFIPKSKGGYLTVYACSYCQKTKKNQQPLEWIEKIEKNKLYDDIIIERIKLSIYSLLKLSEQKKFIL